MGKLMTGILTLAFAASTLVVLPSTSAQASTACSAESIAINTTSGGERASTASGHIHATGKHYFAYSVNGIWHWNADNDNGRTDKKDSSFGIRQC